MLSDEHITRLQELHRQRFGVNISREQALTLGLQLVRSVAIVNDIPIPHETQTC